MRTEAQKKADEKYKKKARKMFAAELSIDEYNLIDKFSKEKGISKAEIIRAGYKTLSSK